MVDDHEDIRQFVCRVLEREGYVTSQAHRSSMVWQPHRMSQIWSLPIG